MMKRLRVPGLVAASWLLLHLVFMYTSGHAGLLAPFGPVQVGNLLLGFSVLASRLLFTFLFFPWLAWRASAR